MHVTPEDIGSIRDRLIQEREGGNEFVVFPEGTVPVRKDELVYVQTQQEAMECCYEYGTDRDSYSYMPIRSAYRAINEALQRGPIPVQADGLIDVRQLVEDRYQRLAAQQQPSIHQHNKTIIMNENNYDYLKNQLKFTGFGENHADALKKNLQEQKPDFVLYHRDVYGKDEIAVTLHFRKSEETDMYFFNKYNIHLKQEGDDAIQKQMIYLRSKEDNITLKESYNLLKGRAVFKERTNKEGEKYQAWVTLDLTNPDKDGNFRLKSVGGSYDIDKAVTKYAIAELRDPDVKAQIVDSLKRGNVQEVTFENEGKKARMFIEANPASGYNHAVKVYDQQMQRVQGLGQGEKKVEAQAAEQSQEKKTALKNKDSAEDAPAAQEKKGRRKARGIA